MIVDSTYLINIIQLINKKKPNFNNSVEFEKPLDRDLSFLLKKSKVKLNFNNINKEVHYDEYDKNQRHDEMTHIHNPFLFGSRCR